MSNNVTLQLTEDEVEILVDALESDLEGYVDAAKDARANRNQGEVATFTAASDWITAVLKKVQAALA